MKKNAHVFNRNSLALLVGAAFAVAFLCVPTREANAGSFGLSVNTGSVAFGLGIADPYPAYVIAPAPRYVLVPPPPPPRPMYGPRYMPPPPPPRPMYGPRYMPPPRHMPPPPPPRAYRW